MHSFTDYPYPQYPPLPYLLHPTFYSPIPHPDTLYPYIAPQRGGENRVKNREEMRQVNEEQEESEGEDKNGERNDNESECSAV
jgi:nitric oxide reductase activation protein